MSSSMTLNEVHVHPLFNATSNCTLSRLENTTGTLGEPTMLLALNATGVSGSTIYIFPVEASHILNSSLL